MPVQARASRPAKFQLAPVNFLRATLEVARKEALQHLRTKRLLVIGLLFTISLVFTTIIVPLAFFNLGSNGSPDFEGLAWENVVFLIFLNAPLIGGYFFIQLLSIVLTSDGVVSEWQRKTIFLLLSKPVSRAAFVIGKFLGSVVPLTVTIGALMLIDYALLQVLLPGSPSAEQVGRFFGGVGMILLGMAAFAAMGLFFSTLTRSSAASLVMTLAFAFVIFPLIGGISDFTRVADDFDGQIYDEDHPRYDWSHYFHPGLIMVKAGSVISEGNMDGGLVAFIPQSAPNNTLLSVLSTATFMVFFLGLALLSVLQRNFE